MRNKTLTKNLTLCIIALGLIVLSIYLFYHPQDPKLCTDFQYQWQAQKAFMNAPLKYRNLDGNDNDGWACEGLPGSGARMKSFLYGKK